MSGVEQVWEEIAARVGATDGPHKNVIAKGRELLDSEGAPRRTRADDALTLYHGSTRYQFDSSSSSQLFPELEPTGYNLIRACTDTLTNHIVRNKVRPMFVTERGSSDLKEKALGMQRAVEGEFIRSGLWDALGTMVCRHGNMFDAGGVKVFPDFANKRAGIELIYAHEFLVSPAEAMRGDPRQAWHVQCVPREVLAAQYSDDADAQAAIKDAPRASAYAVNYGSSNGAMADSIADMVEIWEYWHLPSCYVDRSDDKSWGKRDGKRDRRVDPGHDGRHIICIEGCTLLDEPWVFDFFPVAWFRPARTAVGYWSVGIPERLAPNQIKLNQIQDRIDKIENLHAVPTLLVSRQAKLNVQKITNSIAKILEVNGSPQQAAWYLTPQSVPAELYQRIEDLIRWSEKEVGLSEMSIAARKPAGVDHAPGLQHLADTESIRQTIIFREWEQFFIQAARLVVEAFRQLAQFDEDFEVVFADSKQLQHIRWTDVDIEDERWHLRCWPTNLLPQTPGARKSYVMDLYNAGFFSRDQAALALDFPDIEAISGDTTAALDNIERLIDAAVRGEEVVTPEPYMNLQLCQTTCVNTINRMEADGEDPEAIDRVRQLWEDTNELLARMAPPPVPQGGDPGMPPAPPPAPVAGPPIAA